MNLTIGGDGVAGRKLSAEHKRKISEYQKGRKDSPETCRKRSEALKGRKLPEKQKLQLSLSMMGKYTGEDNPFFGKKHTNEARTRMSEAHKGKFFMSEAGKQNRIKLMSGEKNSSAKLTNEQVRYIRCQYSLKKYTVQQLIERYAVSESTIRKLLRGATYANI